MANREAPIPLYFLPGYNQKYVDETTGQSYEPLEAELREVGYDFRFQEPSWERLWDDSKKGYFLEDWESDVYNRINEEVPDGEPFCVGGFSLGALHAIRVAQLLTFDLVDGGRKHDPSGMLLLSPAPYMPPVFDRFKRLSGLYRTDYEHFPEHFKEELENEVFVRLRLFNKALKRPTRIVVGEVERPFVQELGFQIDCSNGHAELSTAKGIGHDIYDPNYIQEARIAAGALHGLATEFAGNRESVQPRNKHRKQGDVNPNYDAGNACYCGVKSGPISEALYS